MQLLEDGIIAALAAVGLIALLWLPVSLLARPCKKDALDAAVLVPCAAGEGARLEQTVRALERARREYGGFRRIVIVDRGMDEEDRRIAALLCRDGRGVTLREQTEESTIFT